MVLIQRLPPETTPTGPVAVVMTSAGSASPRILVSASSLLPLLAPHIMSLEQGQMSPLSTLVKATVLPATTYLALPALNLATDDLLEEFLNFSVSDFMHLPRSCINMIMNGWDFLELKRSMLNSYLDNIKRIMGRERAAPY